MPTISSPPRPHRARACLALGALWIVAGLVGCAGAARPVAEPGASASAERCLIEGIAHELLVAVPGVAVPEMRASGVPAELAFPLEPATDRVPAHVLSPIDFTGEARLEAVHLVASVPIVRGPITVHPGAPLGRARLEHGALRATLALAGDASEPELAVTFEVACTEIALGPEGAPPPDVIDPVLPTHVLVGTQDLPVSREPDGPTVITLAVGPGSGEPLQLEVVEERDGFAHVRSRLSWAELDGWVPAGRVRAEPTGGWRMLGDASFTGRGGCGRSDHPYSYRGPARVRGGATVHEEASRVVWGRFAHDAEVEIGVRTDGGNGFAEVIRVPGIDTPECGTLEFDHAMVPLESVVLP